MEKKSKEIQESKLNNNHEFKDAESYYKKEYSRRAFISTSGKLIALGALSFFNMAKKMSAAEIKTIEKIAEENDLDICISCDNQCELCNILTGGGGCEIGCDSKIHSDKCVQCDYSCETSDTCSTGHEFCRYETERP